MALLNCTRKPRFTRTLPLSSTQGTENWMNLSGSTKRSIMPFFSYSGCFSTTHSRLSRTSRTAWWNSASPGLRDSTVS